MLIKDEALANYKSIESDVKKWMSNKGTVTNKLKQLNTSLEQRKSDQKEILLERIRDREHADIYTEMLEKCESDIQKLEDEIKSIQDYNSTIKKRKAEMKDSVQIIDYDYVIRHLLDRHDLLTEQIDCGLIEAVIDMGQHQLAALIDNDAGGIVPEGIMLHQPKV